MTATSSRFRSPRRFVRISLIHLGINVDPAGAPVPAVGLAEMGIEPRGLLNDVLTRYANELATAAHATTKVRTVS
jgi:hypothetical protein